jgi:hypothetical protein
MNYFKYFPKTFYSRDNFVTTDFATNILVRFKVINDALENRSAYYPFVIPEGERADTIADKYYGDAKYAWVINVFNNYVDPLWEWPLSDEEFYAYVTREYGSVAEAKSDIEFYYKTLNGRDYIVDSSQAYDKTQTAYEFESERNEKRRNIKILDSRYISQLEQEMKALFNDG